jgi:NAD(P)-dependent dehydrogenase (short-subunit alcohol dehydrogenase family)
MNASSEVRRAGRMAGRRVLVTGAASGIGAAITELFAREGAKLALIDRSEHALAKVARACEALPLIADLRKSDEVAKTVRTAAERLGGLDCVINAAGVLSVGPFDQGEIEVWEELIAVNLTGPFLVCRAAVEYLRKAEFATIVNVSSGIALRPLSNYAGYAASKAGLLSFTKVIAQELAPTVRVNAVCPGPIETPMIRDTYPSKSSRKKAEELYALGRFGTSSEVAAAVMFLSAEESSFITGISMAVDGGRSFH